MRLPRRRRRDRALDQHLPFPEIVEEHRHPAPFRILDANQIDGLPTNGMADKENRRMIVPLEARALHVALHELAHIKWSPQRVPRVRFDPRVYLAIEDARINLGLVLVGQFLPMPAGDRALVSQLAARDLVEKDYATYILRVTACLGTDVEESVLETLPEAPEPIRALTLEIRAEVRRVLVRGRESAGGPVASHACVLRLARRVAKKLAAFDLLRPGERRPGAGGCLACVHVAKEGTGRGRSRPDGPVFRGGAAELLGGAVRPGVMHIAEPRLEIRVLAVHHRFQRRHRPAAEGSIVAHVHRWPIDGAIFRKTVRRAGGTILVDTSSSMSLDLAQIEELLQATRGAGVVAIYSGRGEEGELRIVARGDRRAASEHLEPFGGANVVDLPALEWLARQPAPRIWISDGCVSGVGDRGSPELREACRAARERGGIERIGSVDEAVEVFRRRRA